MHLQPRLLVLMVAFLLLPACAQPTPLPPPTAFATGTAPAPTASDTSVATPAVAAAATARPVPSETSSTAGSPSATVFVLPPTPTPTLDQPGAGPYHLRAWAAADADQLVGLIHDWLNTIATRPEYKSRTGLAAYDAEFAIAGRTEDEALLRFPGAAQADTWRWARAHDMAVAHGSSPAVTQNYAQLMAAALNSGQVTTDTLPAWFASHQKDIFLTLNPLPAPPGYQASDIVEAVSPTCLDCKLGAHWWIVEKNGQYTVQGLKSNLYWYTEAGGSFAALDLTGDGYPELALNYGAAQRKGVTTTHDLYDLSQVPARPMTVIDQYGAPLALTAVGDSSLTARDAVTDRPGFVYTETVGDPYTNDCNPVAVHTFDWTGAQLAEARVTYAIAQDPDNLAKPICQFIQDKALSSAAVEALIPALTTVDQKTTEQAEDEILFKLAEFEARTGQTDTALALFQQEANHPNAATDNPYSSAASVFAQNLHAPGDFYRTCLTVTVCDQTAALAQLARGLYAGAYPSSLEALRQAGAPLLASGQFNFSQVGGPAIWFTVSCACQSQPEFWVLARAPAGAQALYVAPVASPQPALDYWTSEGLPRVVRLEGQTLFTVALMRDGQTAFIKRFNQNTTPARPPSALDKDWGDFDAAAARLLGGGSPGQALADLNRLGPALTRHCKNRACDEFYYTLGLANELAHNEPAAVAAYVKLWQTFPDSPYAIMARAKLVAAP